MRNLITFVLFKDALQELKTAIRASGEHKQRVVIHVAVDGLKIREWDKYFCYLNWRVNGF